MFYKINLRFRCFSSRTGHLTGLNTHYIGFIDLKAPPGNANSRAHYLLQTGFYHGPATISPCTITMDHDAIICFMID